MGKRTRYSPEFKARVALDALRGEQLRIPTDPYSRSDNIRTGIPEYPDSLTATAERGLLMSVPHVLVKGGGAMRRGAACVAACAPER